jgi:hypothetical protein
VSRRAASVWLGATVETARLTAWLLGWRCRRIRRINRTKQDWQGREGSFIALVSSKAPECYHVADELQLLQRITDDLPGDWTYKPSTVNDVDSVRFFQKTRVFTLQHFIRLLVARHRFEELLGELSRGKATGSPEAWGQGTGSFEATEREILQQITQCECSAGQRVGATRLGYAGERKGSTDIAALGHNGFFFPTGSGSRDSRHILCHLLSRPTRVLWRPCGESFGGRRGLLKDNGQQLKTLRPATRHPPTATATATGLRSPNSPKPVRA